MHADVDEGAEGRDIGDDALEDHAGPQIGDLLDALLEGRRLEGGTRIAAGLFQLLENVGDGRQAERLVGEVLRLQLAQLGRIADQRADVGLGVSRRMRRTTG